MNTSVINIKTNSEVKKEAKKIASDLGMTLSGVINAYLKQFVRNKSVNFSLEEKASPYLLKSLLESQNDIKKGDIYSFKNEKEAVDFIDNI